MALPAFVLPLMLGFSSAASVWNAVSGKKAADANTKAQSDINQRNIEATQQNNALARQWANEDFDKTNAYNHPLQQMQRLREAGLNPNLVYGNGAQNTATMVRGTQPQTPHLQAPQQAPFQMPDMTGPLSNYYRAQQNEMDMAVKQKQIEMMDQAKDMNNVKMAGMVTKNTASDFALGVARDLRDSTLEAARLKNLQTQTGINKTQLETDMMPLRWELQQQEFKLKSAYTSKQIDNINADIANKMFDLSEIKPVIRQKLKAEIEVLKTSGELREWDLRLRAAGLNPSDPAYMRIIMSLVNNVANKYGVELTQDGFYTSKPQNQPIPKEYEDVFKRLNKQLNNK